MINFTSEEQVVHQLFLKSYALKDPGLFFGKLGVAIACFDYGKRIESPIISDLGYELASGILDMIDHRTSFDFATGVSGIAWGIEYLIQQQYMVCDSNVVCADLDKRMELLCVHRLRNFSIDNGLEGILHYVLMRIKGALQQNSPVPFSFEFLNDLSTCIEAKKVFQMTTPLGELANQFKSFLLNGKEVSYQPDILSFIEGKAFSEEISSAKLGLKKGLAGWLYSFEK